MKRIQILLVALLVCIAPPAFAQQVQRVQTCGTGTPPAGLSPAYMDVNGNLCGIGSGPTSTYQGTLSVSTSVAVSTMMLSNNTTFPVAIGKMVIINTGTNVADICWFGGTCSAGSGSEPLAAGASDTIYLGGATTSPTAFSASGTTLAIHN